MNIRSIICRTMRIVKRLEDDNNLNVLIKSIIGLLLKIQNIYFAVLDL